MIDPFAWVLAYDEEGKIIVVPVEYPPPGTPVQGGEPPASAKPTDGHDDPEFDRSSLAKMGAA